MRGLLVVALVAVVAAAPDASADNAPKPAPVTVVAHGPKTIKVRLSVGKSMPCDASSNRQLYTGPMKAGEQLVWPFHEACACLEQTYDDFPETGWGAPILRCRPNFCINGYCVPDTRFPIHFDIESKRPTG